MVRRFHYVFCWSISVPLYDESNVIALTYVTNHFVSNVRVPISRMRPVCLISQFRFVRACDGSLFFLVRFLVTTAAGLSVRQQRS